MATNKDYCDFATCVALKELGYNYPLELITDYFGVLDIPFHDQKIHLYEAQKWLRKEKQIGVFVSGFKNGYTFWVNNLLSGDTLYQGFFDNQTGEKYKSYEEALLEGIKEAVKILKKELNEET